MVLAHDGGIDFPITESGLLHDDVRALIYTDTISNLASFILGSVLLFTLLVVLSKMLIQRASMTLVCPDMLINAFMPDSDALSGF